MMIYLYYIIVYDYMYIIILYVKTIYVHDTYSDGLTVHHTTVYMYQ